MIFSKERRVSQVSLVETFCLLSSDSASEQLNSSASPREARVATKCETGNDRFIAKYIITQIRS